MIVINFKAYREATGEKAVKLSEKCSEVSGELDERIISCPQFTDMKSCKGEVFSQHIDEVELGSHTGSVTAEAVESANASGCILNHSERRLDQEKLEDCLERAKDAGLTTIVCAQTPEECEKFSELGPDYVAYEPPELIGGDISVSSARPEMIEEAYQKCSVDLLAGAGINSREDVEKALELGCEGVLVASAVIKSEKPGRKIRELADGL
jgi:triosephosphate isomerase